MSKRTIFTTIIFPILLVAVLVVVLVNNQQELPGELVFTENKLNFGTIPEWEGTVTRSVIARNVGKTTLKINRIKAGCSYAKITGPELLQPNEEGTFTVVLDPKIVPSDSTAATAIIFTDSPRTPQVYLTIVATAKQFATLSADICDFGQIIPETTYDKKIRLCVNAPLDLEAIRLLPSSHTSLSWEMSPDPNSECFIITIQLQSPEKWRQENTEALSDNLPDLFSSILTVAFPNERTLSLQITASIVRPVTAQPTHLSFGIVDKDANPSTEFTISAKKDFKVKSIQVPDYLQIVVPDDWTQSPLAYNEYLHQEKRFKVFWDVPNSPILLREEIQILTTADKTSITIPVYGLIHNQESNSKTAFSTEE